VKATLIAATIVAGGFAFALAGVQTRPALPACPTGLRADRARAAQLVALTRSTSEGGALITRAPQPLQICFADEGTGVVRSDGVFVLAATGDARLAAARLGHLLHHQIEGVPLHEPLAPDRSCTDLVAEAMVAEAQAHALEIRLRRELGLADPLWSEELEAEFWAAPRAAQFDLVHRFLTGADGRPGAPNLEHAYTQRCNSLRARGTAP